MRQVQINMTTNQLSTGAERLNKAIATVERQLRTLAQEMAVLHRQIRAGDAHGLKQQSQFVGEIRQWLSLAYELEKRLEKSGTVRGGRDAPQSIDLDDVRHQIGCRLDRLRRARCPGRFPE